MYLADKVASLILIAFFTFVYYLSISFPPRVASYPKILAVIGAVVSILLFLNAYFKEKRIKPKNSTKEKKYTRKQMLNLIYTGITTLSYIILIPVMGYAVSTFLFMFTLMWILNTKNKFLYIIVASVSTLILYGVFGKFLNVWLPKGFLF